MEGFKISSSSHDEKLNSKVASANSIAKGIDLRSMEGFEKRSSQDEELIPKVVHANNVKNEIALRSIEGYEISSSHDGLPPDIIFEILTRTWLVTLHQCRFVCKDWCRFTHQYNFTRLHCQRTRTVSGYFFQSVKKCVYYKTFVSIHQSPSTIHPSLDFLPCKVKIEASSNHGLLLCTGRGSRVPRYYICKPITQEWRSLPNPKTRYLTEKIAMVVHSDPLRFNIIRFSQSKSRYDINLRCEIFDSKCWAWKRSKDIQLPYSWFLDMGPAIWVNGAFHWLTNRNYIFSFNICGESWKMIPLPEEAMDAENHFPNKKLLVKREGKLALFNMKNDWADLWVMIDYSNEVWIKQQRVNLETLIKDPCNEIVALHTTDILLVKSFYKVIWFDCQDYTWTETKINMFDCQEVFTFQSDLEFGFLKNRI